MLDPPPNITTFRAWKHKFYTIIQRAADRRDDSALAWVQAVEKEGAVITDFGVVDPEWMSMELKLAEAVFKIAWGTMHDDMVARNEKLRKREE